MSVVQGVIDGAWGAVRVNPATLADAEAILRLRDDLAVRMVRDGVEQWVPGEMPLAWVEECVRQGWIYVASRDERLIGSVTIAWRDPLVWGESEEPAGYVHMLMVDPAFGGHGLGSWLLEWSEERIARSGRQLVRLDCAVGNSRLRAFYERAGYRLVGHKVIERASGTALYEKRLAP